MRCLPADICLVACMGSSHKTLNPKPYICLVPCRVSSDDFVEQMRHMEEDLEKVTFPARIRNLTRIRNRTRITWRMSRR